MSRLLSTLAWLARRPRGRGRPRRHRVLARRARQRRLLRGGGARHVPRRVPLLLHVHRRARPLARRDAGDAGRAAATTATTSSPRTSGSSSATTSRRSPARGRSSARRSRRSSATCPGTLWIVVGAVLGGCVQDFVILFFSLRRDGRSLGQMARDEIGPPRGAPRHGHRPRDHGHPARGGRARRRERPQALAVGRLHDRRVRCRSRCSWASTCASCARDGARGLGHRLRARARRRRRRPVGRALAGVGAGLHAHRPRARGRGDRLRLRRDRAAGVAAARAARLPLHVRQARRRARSRRAASCSCGRRSRCRRSRGSSTAPAPSSRARSSRSASSRSPAAPSPASTRSSRRARRRSC